MDPLSANARPQGPPLTEIATIPVFGWGVQRIGDQEDDDGRVLSLMNPFTGQRRDYPLSKEEWQGLIAALENPEQFAEDAAARQRVRDNLHVVGRG